MSINKHESKYKVKQTYYYVCGALNGLAKWENVRIEYNRPQLCTPAYCPCRW